MKLKDEEKEKLKETIQNSDNDRQKREFMDAEQKEEFKKEKNSEELKGSNDKEKK